MLGPGRDGSLAGDVTSGYPIEAGPGWLEACSRRWKTNGACRPSARAGGVAIVCLLIADGSAGNLKFRGVLPMEPEIGRS
jgi:hypothetical protein